MPALESYPGASEFLLESPLYAPFACPSREELQRLFYSGIKADGHCPYCGRATTYSSVDTLPGWGVHSPATYTKVSLACARNGTHRLSFWVRVGQSVIQKIGQDPSHADVANDQSKTYRKILSREDAAEFHKAIGLASHGVGIGSFVYLRRIFERLIWSRFEEFREAEGWNGDDFKKMRMVEKVQLLEGHLPTFLVENAKIYSILSVGIHELSEDACLAFFDVLKESTTTILEEDLRKKAELDRKANLAKAISAFAQSASDSGGE